MSERPQSEPTPAGVSGPVPPRAAEELRSPILAIDIRPVPLNLTHRSSALADIFPCK